MVKISPKTHISNTMKKTAEKVGKIELPENFPSELYAFPLLSGYQSYDSYRRASEENKANTLKLDLFVLASTSLGILGGYRACEAIFKNSKKFGKSSIQKDILQTVGAPVGGVLAGFASGYLGHKMFPIKQTSKHEETKTHSKNLVKDIIKDKKKEKKKKALKQAGIFILTLGGAIGGNKGTRTLLASKGAQKADLNKSAQRAVNALGIAAGSFIGLGIGDKMLSDKKIIKIDEEKADYSMGFLLQTASPSLGSFEAGVETSMKDKIKKTFYQIVANVVVPSAVMLPIMRIVKSGLKPGKPLYKKMDRFSKISNNPVTQKFLAEKGITVPVAIGTYALGRYMGDMFDKKVTKKLLEQDFWRNFTELKKDVMKSSMEGIASNDEKKKAEAIKQLAKMREVEKQAKENFSSAKKSKNNSDKSQKPKFSAVPV